MYSIKKETFLKIQPFKNGSETVRIRKQYKIEIKVIKMTSKTVFLAFQIKKADVLELMFTVKEVNRRALI